jgi:hypothetical protein
LTGSRSRQILKRLSSDSKVNFLKNGILIDLAKSGRFLKTLSNLYKLGPLNMAILKPINLGIRFLLEIGLLITLGYWGFQVEANLFAKILLGLGVPMVVALIWGMFVAPNAKNLLREPWRFWLEIILFSLGFAALYQTQLPQLAVIFFVLFFTNRLFMMTFEPPRR